MYHCLLSVYSFVLAIALLIHLSSITLILLSLTVFLIFQRFLYYLCFLKINPNICLQTYIFFSIKYFFLPVVSFFRLLSHIHNVYFTIKCNYTVLRVETLFRYDGCSVYGWMAGAGVRFDLFHFRPNNFYLFKWLV